MRVIVFVFLFLLIKSGMVDELVDTSNFKINFTAVLINNGNIDIRM